MIILTKKAYFKLKCFTLNTNGEISGLGKSEIVDDEVIIVKDIEIFPQQSSFGSSNLDEQGLAKFLNEKMSKGEDISEWNIWWHSHGELPVFWSITDEQTIETFTGGEFFISLVVNRKMKILGRIDIFKPFRLILNSPVSKPRGQSKKGQEKGLNKYCKRKIKKCVKQTGFFGKLTFLTRKKCRKQSQLSAEEISEAVWPTDWRN